jgi:hypothetical protein
MCISPRSGQASFRRMSAINLSEPASMPDFDGAGPSTWPSGSFYFVPFEGRHHDRSTDPEAATCDGQEPGEVAVTAEQRSGGNVPSFRRVASFPAETGRAARPFLQGPILLTTSRFACSGSSWSDSTAGCRPTECWCLCWTTSNGSHARNISKSCSSWACRMITVSVFWESIAGPARPLLGSSPKSVGGCLGEVRGQHPP